jgi:hypothetical protein
VVRPSIAVDTLHQRPSCVDEHPYRTPAEPPVGGMDASAVGCTGTVTHHG